jgi:thiamine-monophosphate kinase
VFDPKLSDVGERGLVEKFLRPRYGNHGNTPRFGDDCAFVTEFGSVSAGTIVATTDPCPEPVASYLGFNDLYYRGWLLATINHSDLAAAGAKPLGMLTSLGLPNSIRVSEFERLLDGIDDSCRACSSKVIGGNLKESIAFELSATAIGWCGINECTSRFGAREGDLLAVIGNFGVFWASFFAHQSSLPLPQSDLARLRSALLTPVPPVAVAHKLATVGVLGACIDNSDGLYPSVKQLSSTNEMRVDVQLDGVQWDPLVMKIAELLDVDVVRFALGWGDWNLIVCFRAQHKSLVSSISNDFGMGFNVIGRISSGSGVYLSYDGKSDTMARIESERLVKTSWFTAGLESYVQMLRDGSLWETTSGAMGER